MPIFEYKCRNKKNSHTFESYFSVSEIKESLDTKQRCPICNKVCDKQLSRVIGKGGSMKWGGIDDTDQLTLGKIVADGKIPAEFARPLKEGRRKQMEFFKKNKYLKIKDEIIKKSKEPIEIR